MKNMASHKVCRVGVGDNKTCATKVSLQDYGLRAGPGDLSTHENLLSHCKQHTGCLGAEAIDPKP